MSMVPLSEVCDITAGQSAPQDSDAFGREGHPFIRAGSLDALTNGGSENDCEHLTEGKAQQYRMRLFPKDTIVFAKSGMSAKIGRVYRLKAPAYIVSHLAAVTPGKDVDPSYLQRWFERNPPSRLIPNEAYPSIRTSEIGALKIELPKKSEQKRIANILEKAVLIRSKRQQAIKLTDAFLRSVFLDMFGDLFRNSKNWEQIELGRLITDGPQNGLYRPASDYGSGVPILRIDSFYDGYIVPGVEHRRVRITEDLITRYTLAQHDIVVNRVNSRKFLGKCALVEDLSETTVYESNMMRFSVDINSIDPRFLVDQLTTPYIKQQILTKSRDAVNQSSINQGDVQSLVVYVPPLELQRRYSEIVRMKKAYTVKLDTASDQSRDLFLALSQRAFRGDL